MHWKGVLVYLSHQLLRLRTGFELAPERLPAPDPVLHVSAPVRRGVVGDVRRGLA